MIDGDDDGSYELVQMHMWKEIQLVMAGFLRRMIVVALASLVESVDQKFALEMVADAEN